MSSSHVLSQNRAASIVFHPHGPEIESPDPLAHKEHLLKVAAASSRDAANCWDEIYSEIRKHQAAHGAGEHEGQADFSPSMGWRAFVTKFQELRHLIDATERICTHQ